MISGFLLKYYLNIIGRENRKKMGGFLSKREGGLRALPVGDEGLTDQSISSTEAIEGNNGLLNEPLNDNGRETDSDSEYFSANDYENDGDGKFCTLLIHLAWLTCLFTHFFY